MALDPDQYHLSDAEHDAVFQEIRASIFAHAKSARRPVAVIFGGQPRAGKSAALSEAIDELRPRDGAAEIIGDDFRSYYRAFRQFIAQDDKTAAFYTDVCIRDRLQGRCALFDLLHDVIRIAFKKLSESDVLAQHLELAPVYRTVHSTPAYFASKLFGDREDKKAGVQAAFAHLQTRLRRWRNPETLIRFRSRQKIRKQGPIGVARQESWQLTLEPALQPLGELSIA
jgi:hypothetical protein